MTREEAIQVLQEKIDDRPLFKDEREAFDMAIEALQTEAVQVVRCKDCRFAHECHKCVQYTRNEQNTVTIGYSPIEWCSRGERREE